MTSLGFASLCTHGANCTPTNHLPVATPVAHHSRLATRAPQVGILKVGGDCNPHIGSIVASHMQGCRTSRGNAFSKKQYVCSPLAYHDQTTSYNQAGSSKAMRNSATVRNAVTRGKIMQGSVGVHGSQRLC